jgi:hypothetical protein
MGAIPWLIMSEVRAACLIAHNIMSAYAYHRRTYTSNFEFYSSNFERFQILPVGIKSFAGSFATLANMLTSFGVTMTANLLLSWSAGGPYFCLPLA